MFIDIGKISWYPVMVCSKVTTWTVTPSQYSAGTTNGVAMKPYTCERQSPFPSTPNILGSKVRNPKTREEADKKFKIKNKAYLDQRLESTAPKRRSKYIIEGDSEKERDR